MYFFSRVIQWMFLLITFCLLLFILSIGLIQTPFGKAKIAQITAYYLSSYGIQAKIVGIEGFFPFQIRLQEVLLETENGMQIDCDAVEASLSFWALFRKELDVKNFKINKVEILNPPALPTWIQAPSFFSLNGRFLLGPTTMEGALEVVDLVTENPELQLSFSGEFSSENILKTGEITAHFFELPHLLLSGGSLEVKASLKEEEIKASLASSSLTIDAFLLPFHMDAFFSLKTQTGSLSFKAESGDLPIVGKSQFHYFPSSLDFSDLEIEFGKEETTKLEGALSLNTEHFLGEGNLYINSQNLSNLVPLDWYGKCAGLLVFSHTEKEQNVSIKAALESCRLGEMRIQSLFLFLELSDLYHDVYGKGEVAGLGIYSPDGWLETLSLDGRKAPIQGWEIDLNAVGTLKEPFHLKTSFQLEEEAFKLKNLSGEFLHLPVKLQAPCTFSWDPAFITLSPCILRVGDGLIQGYFSWNEEHLTSSLELHHFPLPLLSLFFPKFSLDGYLSMSSSLEGSQDSLQGNLEASLEEAVLTNFSQNDALKTKGSLLAHLNHETLTTHFNLYAPNQQFIETHLTLPIDWDFAKKKLLFSKVNPFSAEMTMEGHIEEIFDFIDMSFHHLTGLINCHLFASGSLSSPFLQGEIDWSSGSYANYLIGTNLKEVQAHFEAERDLLHVTSIQAKDLSGGSLTGDGEVVLNLKEKIPYSFAFSLSDLMTLDFDLLQARLDGSLYISGSFKSALAQGNLLMSKTVFHIPDALPYDIPTIPITFINRQNVEKKSEKLNIFPFSLDLTLTTPDTVLIEGKGLKSKWKGTLHVVGTNLNLAAEGKLTLVSGDYVFAGRNFKLTEGELFFVDEKTKTAYVKMKGVLNLGDLEVVAEVYGPLTRPNLTLQSNPHLPTSSILARVLFNKDISDINQLEAIQLATTLMSMSNGGGPDILDAIRKNLRVDRLTVAPAGKNGEGVAVQIGKYLTKGVMVTLSRSATSTEVIVEVKIGKGFIFEAQSQVEGEGKFSLKWRHTY